MVEENSVDCKNTIGIAIESCGVVGKNFRASVGTLRIKGGLEPLRRRGSAEHLAGARLVECNRFLFVFLIVPDCLKDAQRAERGAVCGVLGNIKRYPHVRLRGEVINLTRFYLIDELADYLAVANVAIVEGES
ncbi:MAG: hypothetical protein UY66_C0032G0004 [Parcubacteria group bacterium GW2011_GWC1_51_35]|nr:MAG: hypothetical protein UY66_C0032G0004 [Parcubacteria group bacterium GW2011_GWC1_51_35]